MTLSSQPFLTFIFTVLFSIGTSHTDCGEGRSIKARSCHPCIEFVEFGSKAWLYGC